MDHRGHIKGGVATPDSLRQRRREEQTGNFDNHGLSKV
jgi:hypothetical protein